ncbi:MAG: alpha/beta fold hydrolase [Rhizobiaceae bacterium]
MRLHAVAIDNSDQETHPVIFLHGFGGMAAQWFELQTNISHFAPTIAFDLPGHGKSLDFPNAGPPKIAAKAVLAEMTTRNLKKVHLVGHSMGGAVASLVALFQPVNVASLTLLAPGGFGEEINHSVLKKWGAAQSRQMLAEVMPSFYSSTHLLPEQKIEMQLQHRKKAGAVEMLTAIANDMTRNGKQGVLPLDAMLKLKIPISLIWGDEDMILPVIQTAGLQDKLDLHLLKGVGHTPAEEAQPIVKALIKKQLLIS